MKTRYILITIFCTTCLFIACEKTIGPPAATVQENTKSDNDRYTITIDEALSNLELFKLGQGTKAYSEDKEIAEIITIMSDGSPATTKSDNSALPLMYIVNYAENSGYSVLSADRRIGTDVLAITEKGNISEKSVYDLTISDSEKLLPLTLLCNYAIQASSTIPIRDSFAEDNTEMIGHELEDSVDIPRGEWVITVWDKVETTNEVPVMLKTEWHQWAPFNNLCGKYAAGCTAVAMMQIMAYNCYPDPFKVGDFTIPFEELREMSSVPNDGSTYAYNVALLTKSIWDYCGDHHDPFNSDNLSTLIWPKHAEKYFKNVLGYKNVERYADNKTCNINMIVRCLKKGYPVFLAAKANSLNAHSWVVDGLVVTRRYGHKEGEDSGIYRGDVYASESYLHCNWGWGGKDDGYFLAGVFDTDLSYNFDYLTKSESDGDYDSYYRIITYEIPEE